MTEGDTVDEWLKFFKDAALPKDFAETYAVTFSKNQMKLDMLPDITKEHLLDMGITLVGHIIAILRHAKTVHSQTVTRTTLSKCPSGSKEKKLDLVPSLPTKPILPQNEFHHTPTSVNSLNGLREAVISSEPPIKKSTKIRLTPAKPVVPSMDVKRIRKVTPEQEGAYRIKMPSGTTSRSREILARQKLVTGESEKKPVFERLGLDTSVSSSTEIEAHDWKTSPAGTPKSEGEGVFSRLGLRCQVSSTAEESAATSSPRMREVIKRHSLMTSENDTETGEYQLPYIGILKTPPKIPTKTVSTLKQPVSATVKERGTLHSDSLVSGTNRPSLVNRLYNDSQLRTNTQSDVVFTITNQVADSKKINVKDRLGDTTPNDTVIKKRNTISLINNKFEPYPLRTDNRRLKLMGEGKKVSFGAVSQQIIPGRLPKSSPNVNRSDKQIGPTTVVRKKSLKYNGSIGMGTGVFARLGH